MPGTAVSLPLAAVPSPTSRPPALPPPSVTSSNTGIIQFYEKPPGLPLNGPTTTGTRCAVSPALGDVREGGRRERAWAGGWESLGTLFLLAAEGEGAKRREREGKGAKQTSQKAACACVHVCARV